MKYYSYDWDKMMAVPLRLFWTLLKNMYRIEAQENLRWTRLLSMGNVTEEARKEFVQDQMDQIGVVQVTDERDEEGINKLKQLASAGF
jgi:hypothetical protein